MDEEDGVSNIEQFSTSEDSNVSPSQRKRGARPEAHVKKKSRTEDLPPPIDMFKLATLNVRGLNSDKLGYQSLCEENTLTLCVFRKHSFAMIIDIKLSPDNGMAQVFGIWQSAVEVG